MFESEYKFINSNTQYIGQLMTVLLAGPRLFLPFSHHIKDRAVRMNVLIAFINM